MHKVRVWVPELSKQRCKEEPLRVCELGCGCSHLAPMLRDAGARILAVTVLIMQLTEHHAAGHCGRSGFLP